LQRPSQRALAEGPAADDIRAKLQSAGFRIAKFSETRVNTGDRHHVMRCSLRWRALPHDTAVPSVVSALAKADGVLQLQWKP
jgi:hypothetical protein